jgi:hypothetical protein
MTALQTQVIGYPRLQSPLRAGTPAKPAEITSIFKGEEEDGIGGLLVDLRHQAARNRSSDVLDWLVHRNPAGCLGTSGARFANPALS